MTNHTKRPGMGLYFAAILLLLGAYYFFYGSMGIPAVTFAQVETLFEDGKVISFSIRDGNDLYLNLTDGSTVHNQLGSTDLFWSRLGSLIQEQKHAGILSDYDHAPVYTPPWWMEVLVYVALIRIIFQIWR